MSGEGCRRLERQRVREDVLRWDVVTRQPYLSQRKNDKIAARAANGEVFQFHSIAVHIIAHSDVEGVERQAKCESLGVEDGVDTTRPRKCLVAGHLYPGRLNRMKVARAPASTDAFVAWTVEVTSNVAAPKMYGAVVVIHTVIAGAILDGMQDEK